MVAAMHTSSSPRDLRLPVGGAILCEARRLDRGRMGPPAGPEVWLHAGGSRGVGGGRRLSALVSGLEWSANHQRSAFGRWTESDWCVLVVLLRLIRDDALVCMPAWRAVRSPSSWFGEWTWEMDSHPNRSALPVLQGAGSRISICTRQGVSRPPLPPPRSPSPVGTAAACNYKQAGGARPCPGKGRCHEHGMDTC